MRSRLPPPRRRSIRHRLHPCTGRLDLELRMIAASTRLPRSRLATECGGNCSNGVAAAPFDPEDDDSWQPSSKIHDGLSRFSELR